VAARFGTLSDDYVDTCVDVTLGVLGFAG